MSQQQEMIARDAPMAPAPMRYNDDGTAAWDEMWDTFCILALEGGPRHRATLLRAEPASDTTAASYQFAVAEIVRGVGLVSGLSGAPAEPGWVKVTCHSAGMAQWLAEAIVEENVEARASGNYLSIPVGTSYTLKGESKNVITAIAKTTHYWHEHMPIEAKQTLDIQARFGEMKARFTSWFRRRPAGKAQNAVSS